MKIQYVLGSGVVSRGWVEQLERKREKGGWAEQCPTEGGTDEVREKWREKRQEELRKGALKRGHFLSQKQSHRRKPHSHLSYRNKTLSETKLKDVHIAEPKFMSSTTRNT